MRVLDNLAGLQVPRRVRAFLNPETSVVHDTSPENGQEVLRRKNQRIAQLRRRVARAEEELAGLRASSPDGTTREDASIFFIAGLPRSGTTWLRQMLDRHPEILCHGEGRFFDREDKDPNFGTVPSNNMEQLLRPGSLHNILAECEPLRIWMERTWWSRDDDVEEHILNFTGGAVRYLLMRKLADTGKSIVGDKTPIRSARIIGEIGSMFPEARVIHIIRDGRDQAVSHAHHRWRKIRSVEEGGRLTLEEKDKRDRYRENPEKFQASGESIFLEQNIVSAAKGWRSTAGFAHRDGPSVLGDRYTEVRYEDLLERPEEEMGRLFRFLGARVNEHVVRRCVESNRFEKMARRESGSEDSASFFRKGVAGDWRNVFTERDKTVYKEIAGDMLVELGYEQDDDW